MPNEFEIKDSGERASFAGGMVRDTCEGKINWLSVRVGPMLKRWADHCTKGREKYPDPEPGVPNWTLAEGPAELLRFQESAARHFEAWLAGERDEDHAAGVYFNINGAEFVRDKMAAASMARFDAAVRNLPEVTSDDNPEAECPVQSWMGPDNCASMREDRPWRIITDKRVPVGFGILVGLNNGQDDDS